MKLEEKVLKQAPAILSGIIILLVLFIAACMMYGCTISVNNVRTSGEATDLIDEDQEATSDAALSIPAKLV